MLIHAKKSTLMIVVGLAMLAGVYFGVFAGNLEPPGPPAPTMVTLQEISDKLEGLGVVGVPQTGQTGCWNGVGGSIPCAGTGQDGDYQAGVSVAPRFTDNGDGTVKDNQMGLIWLKDANCFLSNWPVALLDANGLADGSCGLTDNSVAGDWRLPNIRELHSLIDFGQTLPALPAGHPFTGVQLGSYWSSTTDVGGAGGAWSVLTVVGTAFPTPKSSVSSVWPVRGGQ